MPILWETKTLDEEKSKATNKKVWMVVQVCDNCKEPKKIRIETAKKKYGRSICFKCQVKNSPFQSSIEPRWNRTGERWME